MISIENNNKISVLSQYIKGGFNDVNIDIGIYMANQKKYAENTARFRNTRRSKVTKWLRNIEKFENKYPKLAAYYLKD